MKKNILILIFLFNISPNIQNNQLSLNVCSKAYAQWNQWGTGCSNNTGGGNLSGNNTNWWNTFTGWLNDIGIWIGQQWNNSISTSSSSSEPWSIWLSTNSAGIDPNQYGGGGYSGGNIYTSTGYGTPSCPLALINGQFVFTCSNLSANDCQGVAFGYAYLDSCNKCVGGTTGLLPCKGYWDSNNIFVDSVRKQPCDSFYKKMGDSLYAFLNKPEFQDSLNKFKENTINDTLEKAISFGRDTVSGIFKTTGIHFATSSTATPLINSWPIMQVMKMLHFHPISDYVCFSVGDLYSLQGLFSTAGYTQINSHYAYGAFDSSMFAMQIEDSLLYSQYLSGHPISTTMDANHIFDTAKNIGKDFDNVRTYLRNFGGLSDDDSFTQATAFVYSKYNTGMTLFRKRRNEDKFTKINTKETIDSGGNKTYTPTNCL